MLFSKVVVILNTGWMLIEGKLLIVLLVGVFLLLQLEVLQLRVSLQKLL